MKNSPTFWDYYGRFLVRMAKDATPWARDNIVLAFLMVVVAAAAAWLRDSTHVPDWVVLKTTGWIYLALFVVYAIYHTIRAPWKLDRDRAEKLAITTTSRDELASKLREIEDARPNIILRDPGAEHIQSVSMNVQFGGALILSFAKVRFINKPSNPAQRIEAKRLWLK